MIFRWRFVLSFQMVLLALSTLITDGGKVTIALLFLFATTNLILLLISYTLNTKKRRGAGERDRSPKAE